MDIDNLSVVNAQQYQQLLAQFELYHPYLTKIAEPGGNGFFLHYLRWYDRHDGDIPRDLLDALMQHNAHDTLAPDRYLACLRARWERFAECTRSQDDITILECSLLQNPLTVFLGKHNISPADVKSSVYALAECVRALNPVVIHLRGKSVRDTLERVIATRPREWIDLVIDYVTHQGYGSAHKLQGLEGVITFYEAMQSLEDEIIADLPWGKLVIGNSDGNWARYHAQIEVFLEPYIA